MRIVSLLPAATEIIAAMDLGDQLVGRSHECDYPPQVNGLQLLTTPKFEAEGDSQSIDQSIRDLVARGLSIYEVNTALLEEMAPDYIITQSQCEVCAVNRDEVVRAAQQLVHSEPQIIDLQPNSYDDVFADIFRIGTVLARQPAAQRLVEAMQGRIAEVEKRVSDVASRPSVMCVEWLAPLMSAGNWIPNLVEKAGGTPLLSQAGAHSQELAWDDLVAADPDYILVMPCGYGIAQSRNEMKQLTQQPGWADLKAVKKNHVFLVDGNQYFNRPGPRIADSVEILAEIFHPHLFAASYAPNGWMQHREVYL